MPEGRAEYDREAPRVAFLSASDLRDLNADPVLEPADYWERGGR